MSTTQETPLSHNGQTGEGHKFVVKLRVKAVKASKAFRVCTPAAFKVSEYTGTPADKDKKRVKWQLRDATTGVDLLNATPKIAREEGDKLIIDCVPFDWRDHTIEVRAYFVRPTNKPMLSLKPQSCQLFDWIALIKKAEVAYPALSGVQMTNALRWVAGYDNALFRALFSGSPRGFPLAPAGSLTQADIDQMQGWTRHAVAAGVEAGVVKDFDGTPIAAGHVLTGLSGGVYRNRSVDITPSGSLAAGETLDSLYAATISGDLGQAACFVNRGRQAKPYIGLHGDATEGELIGDLDGFLLGDAEPHGGSSVKLSEILIAYYSGCNQQGARARFSRFSSTGVGVLKDQVYRFASTYKYHASGMVGGLFSELETEANEAYDEFMDWLRRQVRSEAARNGPP